MSYDVGEVKKCWRMSSAHIQRKAHNVHNELWFIIVLVLLLRLSFLCSFDHGISRSVRCTRILLPVGGIFGFGIVCDENRALNILSLCVVIRNLAAFNLLSLWRLSCKTRAIWRFSSHLVDAVSSHRPWYLVARIVP